jgi:hypothetical protein
MKDETETIEVRLVPMAEEDKKTLRQATTYLTNLGRLLDRDDWEGWQTLEGLMRIDERISVYAMTYHIPIPMGMRSKQPLFTGEKEEEVVA